MSDAEQQSPAWDFYIEDMLEFGEKVLSFLYRWVERSYAFLADSLTYEATLLNILLIGEAARHIPHDVREAYLDIPWNAIIGTRNRVIHGYRQVDQAILWSIIQDAIPALIPQLQKLLEDVQKEKR